MSYVVYILKNTHGKLYIGQTSGIDRRMQEHNETGLHYTSKYRPWELIYTEEYDTRSEAMGREKYLKTGVGRDWIHKNILHL